MVPVVLCVWLVSLQPAPQPAPSWQEFNTLMMRATFRISGPARGDPKTITTGTAFLSGTAATAAGRSPYVLVTAAHVLERIEGEHADLALRRERPDGGFERFDYRVQIRRQGANVYVRHPVADVAAMYLSMPDEATFGWIGPGAIGGDDLFERFNVHPGDELLAVGFPLGLEANAAGFPILRSGRIASYPLTPASRVRTFLLDLHVFEGNSGAPVYLYDRTRVVRGVIQLGQEVNFVAGLIGQLSTAGDRSLELAVIVPAQFIRETIARFATCHAQLSAAGRVEQRQWHLSTSRCIFAGDRFKACNRHPAGGRMCGRTLQEICSEHPISTFEADGRRRGLSCRRRRGLGVCSRRRRLGWRHGSRSGVQIYG